MQYIPKPLHVLTHPVEKYIEWVTCDLSEQHKKLEPPQIRKKGKKIKNYLKTYIYKYKKIEILYIYLIIK